MDCSMTGALIRQLRCAKNMTQNELAALIGVTDKAVSKWERGGGFPDVQTVSALSEILGVSTDAIIGGKLPENEPDGGNMKKSKYYVCKECGSISIVSGDAEVVCCGRTLQKCDAVKSDSTNTLNVEQVEDEWFITSEHPMQKENYIRFVAFATGESIAVYKMYPEWDMQLRIPKKSHGMLLWYADDFGLLYKLI